MNLVKCPFCKHAFSPTPGQVIKCPGCLKTLKRAGSGGETAKKAPPRREVPGMREALDKKSGGNPLVSFLITASVVGAIGAGGFYWFTRPTADSPVKPAAVAEAKKAAAVVAPKATPKVEDDEDPLLKEFQPKVETKVRPIEASPPEVKEEGPKEPPAKVVRVVPGVDPDAIVAAMKKGSEYLIRTGKTWTNSTDYPIGNAALAGVALLE